MAWKCLSMLQANDAVDAAEFPGGAYRIRFLHNTNPTTFGAHLGDLIADGKYVLPYLETESTYPNCDDGGVVRVGGVDNADWAAKMSNFASAFAAAGVEYIEFGNEPNSPAVVANRNRLWDAYGARLEASAPIFRAAGVGVMLTSLGQTSQTGIWIDRLNSGPNKVTRCIDAAAIHTYSGGTHVDGSPGGGLPSDTLKRTRDAVAALRSRMPDRPEVDVYITEFGWPSYWAATPDDQPGITDPGHLTYSTPAQQKTKMGDAYQLLFNNANQDQVTPTQFNRIRAISWFHSWDYRDGQMPSFATTLAGYTWPGSGTVEVDTIEGMPDEPNTLTNGTQIVDYTGVRVTGAGTVPDPFRYWIDGLSGGSGTYASGTQLKWDTPGGWAHHQGIRYEAGTPRVIANGGNPHKQSWSLWDDPLETDYIGPGRGLAGVKPVCVRGTVSSIGGTTATVSGTVDPNSLATSWRIEHGPDATFGSRTTTQTAGSGGSAGPVSRNLTGLPSGTTVFWRIIAWNDAGFSWSTVGTFNTMGVGPFLVTPNRSVPAGSIPRVTNEPIPSVSHPALLPNTTYYYRIVASNSAGVSYGSTESFATVAPPTLPTVTTGEAGPITLTGATLNGTVNPNGDAVSDYHFEYGPSTAYGSATAIGTLPASSTTSTVSAVIGGLAQGATIHFRLVATNSHGTTNGLPRSFVVTPPAIPGDPTSVLSTLLTVELTTHDGRHYRWDMEDADPQNHPLSTTFSTQMGDGFAEGSCVLPRPIDLDYPDLHLLDRIRFIGSDASIAYEGRVAGLPRRVDSDGEAIEVQLQGLMSSARDRTFMEVYADRSTDRWQQASLALRVAYGTAGHPLDTDFIPQVDTGSFSFKGVTNKNIQVGSQGVLTWKAPVGCKAALIYYRGIDRGGAWIDAHTTGPGLYAKDDDTTTFDDWEVKFLTFGDTLRTETLDTPRTYLGMRLFCDVSGNPPDNQAPHRIVHRICVYGNHGLELREAVQGPPGVFASDVMTNVIERFCPQLNADGVRQTATVLSHLTFDTPTTPFDCFTLLNGYHLWTLGAWENGRVDYGPADLTRADWQLRREDPGVTLDLQGDTTDQFANGIVVSYTDIDERAQVLWPTDYPDQLADLDPDNPANRQGIELWTSLELSNPVTRADALALGEAALAEFNRPKAPGTVNVTLGYVEDSRGNLQPGHKVRANQTLSITDLPNDSPRLITATSWTEDGQLSITLEQPPTRVDAVLARLDLSQRSKGIG